jgi:hypothetical protein
MRKIGFWGKLGIGVAAIVVLTIFGFIVFWIGWVEFVDNYKLGFTFNRFSGEIKPLERTGYFILTPYKYAVHSIDLRPYQISITANFGQNTSPGVASRVLNAKLVKFEPAGLQTFVAWHGRNAGDRLHNLTEIMKCYAFDKEEGKDCPFITVLSEINPSQTPLLPPGEKEKK